jgi:hypothetical protein
LRWQGVRWRCKQSLSDIQCNGKMWFESKEVECNKKWTTKLCQRCVTKKCGSVGQVTACNDSNFWHLSEHKWALWMDSYSPIPFDLWLNTPCSASWPPSICIQYNTWHVLHTPPVLNLWLNLSCTGQMDIIVQNHAFVLYGKHMADCHTYIYDDHAPITCCLYFHKIQEDAQTDVSVTDLRLSQTINMTTGIQSLSPRKIEKSFRRRVILFAYSWDLRPSAVLHSADRLLVTDVSGQPIGPYPQG